MLPIEKKSFILGREKILGVLARQKKQVEGCESINAQVSPQICSPQFCSLISHRSSRLLICSNPLASIENQVMASYLHLSSLVLGYLLASASANPVPEAEPDPIPQISLPPLIPSVPGFADPLSSLTPPLPVLQVPTPPKDSPPFVGSNIKPKKIGYFWTGAGDNQHAGS